ncbi:MAG: dihydroorotate dehydrogenase-like protein [Alkalispirochaeta sp.]
MADMRVRYMGLELDNPFVVSSSSLTDSIDKVEACQAAGAGAVVLKSLFEEEIQAEIDADSGGTEHTEAADYIREIQTEAGLKRYTDLIRGAKEAVKIPVIASINAVSHNWWEEQVAVLEAAGADALELNISLMPYDYRDDEAAISEFYVKTVEAVRRRVSIPISVKIGYYFSSIPAMVDRLRWAGAAAVVLFNRFYPLDIDIETMALRSASPFSTTADLTFPLRWITMIYGKTQAELVASGGVHRGEDAVKALLAGAQAVQVCSTLYENGLEHLTPLRTSLEQWMDAHSYASIDQFRGKMSQKRSDRPETFERLQYIQALVGRS